LIKNSLKELNPII